MKTIYTIILIWRGLIKEVASFEEENEAKNEALKLAQKHNIKANSYDELLNLQEEEICDYEFHIFENVLSFETKANYRMVSLIESEDESVIMYAKTNMSDETIEDVCCGAQEIGEAEDETMDYEEKLEAYAKKHDLVFERVYVDETIYV